jgi:hypothetical protein
MCKATSSVRIRVKAIFLPAQNKKPLSFQEDEGFKLCLIVVPPPFAPIGALAGSTRVE